MQSRPLSYPYSKVFLCLPIWITGNGNISTFKSEGWVFRLRFGLLTLLLVHTTSNRVKKKKMDNLSSYTFSMSHVILGPVCMCEHCDRAGLKKPWVCCASHKHQVSVWSFHWAGLTFGFSPVDLFWTTHGTKDACNAMTSCSGYGCVV